MRSSAQACKPDPASGFTFIEILVATAILALSSLMIYQAINATYERADRMTYEADRILSISVATQALGDDIAQIFTPPLGKTRPPTNDDPGEFWSAPQRRDGLRRTRFQGSREKISFISSSNRRLRQNVPESDLHKVIWEIEQQEDGTYALYRTTDSNVFDYFDEEAGNRENKKFPVLEGMAQGKFSFYLADKEQWENTWDSESRLAEGGERFPSLVAFEFELGDPADPSSLTRWRSEFTTLLDINSFEQQPEDPRNPRERRDSRRRDR